jgi:hypothetical protein
VTPASFRIQDGKSTDESSFHVASCQALIRTLLESEHALVVRCDTDLATELNVEGGVNLALAPGASNKPFKHYYLFTPEIESRKQTYDTVCLSRSRLFLLPICGNAISIIESNGILQKLVTREMMKLNHNEQQHHNKVVLPDSLTTALKKAIENVPLSEYNPLEITVCAEYFCVLFLV